MMLMPKEVRINVRTTEEIKRDLEITARLKGLTVSALVNSLVVSSIRKEKEREPQAFRQLNLKDNATNENQPRINNSPELKSVSSQGIQSIGRLDDTGQKGKKRASQR